MIAIVGPGPAEGSVTVADTIVTSGEGLVDVIGDGAPDGDERDGREPPVDSGGVEYGASPSTTFPAEESLSSGVDAVVPERSSVCGP